MNDVQPVLSAHALSRSFYQGEVKVDVLHEIDLQVKSGDRIAILGASGSGKSTLLHCLGGLDRPTSGQVRIMGDDLIKMKERVRSRLRNRSLGFVYQFHHLLAEFTALENVAMPLIIGDTEIAEAIDRASEILNRVGLGKRLNHKPAALSGGERQRAALARALVHGPQCVLADEPTGNLDRESAHQVYELMLELNRSRDTSLLIVTHDIELAERMDQVWTLVDGRLRMT